MDTNANKLLIACRHLALVNGICTAGAYSGTIVFGPFLQCMVILRGLYGTLVILAGIASVTAVAALAYRPPPGKASVNKTLLQTKHIFDLTLLKDKSFLVFLLGISLYASGAFIPASYAVGLGRLFSDNHFQIFFINFTAVQ